MATEDKRDDRAHEQRGAEPSWLFLRWVGLLAAWGSFVYIFRDLTWVVRARKMHKRRSTPRCRRA